MVAYNFQSRFAPDVESGKKTQTIRKQRNGKSRHARPGERVDLYTGMRTKAVRHLGEVLCVSVTPVHINEALVRLDEPECRRELFRGGSALRCFAQNDGFDDTIDMLNWFRSTHGLPFDGVLIRWEQIA